MRRLLTFWGCLMSFTFLFSACTEKKEPRIVFYSNTSYEGAYSDAVLAHLSASVSDQFAFQVVTSSDAFADDSVNDIFENAPDCFIVRAVDVYEADYLLELAKAKKIPVVFFEVSPSSEKMQLYSDCWFVEFNPHLLGEVAGTAISAAYKSDIRFNGNENFLLDTVIITQDTERELAASNAFVSTIEDSGLFISLLNQHTVSTTDVPSVIALSYEVHGQTIEAFICTNDKALLEVVNYVSEITPNVIPVIIGIGGTPASLDAVEQNFIIGIAFENPKEMATAVATLALNAAQAKDVATGTQYKLQSNRTLQLPVFLVTNDTLKAARAAYEI